MIDYIKDEEQRNSHLYGMYHTDHDLMSAHIHYVIESWDEEQPENIKEWLTNLLENYGT